VQVILEGGAKKIASLADVALSVSVWPIVRAEYQRGKQTTFCITNNSTDCTIDSLAAKFVTIRERTIGARSFKTKTGAAANAIWETTRWLLLLGNNVHKSYSLCVSRDWRLRLLWRALYSRFSFHTRRGGRKVPWKISLVLVHRVTLPLLSRARIRDAPPSFLLRACMWIYI